jgi:hypothetical protein
MTHRKRELLYVMNPNKFRTCEFLVQVRTLVMLYAYSMRTLILVYAHSWCNVLHSCVDCRDECTPLYSSTVCRTAIALVRCCNSSVRSSPYRLLYILLLLARSIAVVAMQHTVNDSAIAVCCEHAATSAIPYCTISLQCALLRQHVCWRSARVVCWQGHRWLIEPA